MVMSKNEIVSIPGLEVALWRLGQETHQTRFRGFRLGDKTFGRDGLGVLVDTVRNMGLPRGVARFMERPDTGGALAVWHAPGWGEGDKITAMDAALAEGDIESADAIEHGANNDGGGVVGLVENGCFVAVDERYSHHNGVVMPPPQPEPPTEYYPANTEWLWEYYPRGGRKNCAGL